MVALAASGAWAASFWKGTGPESGEAANWDKGIAFMGSDYFYFRDTKMTGADNRRYMRLTDNANNENGQGMLFQCGTENDPFVIEDDGENRTITLKYSSDSNVGGIYIGHSKNTDNTCYYGGVELRGGIWTCDQIYVGDYVGDGANYCGYLRLNGASLTTTGSSSNPCENGKIVVDAGTLTFAKGLSLGKDGGTAELVVNGGTMSCGGDLLLGSASGDNGSLTVNGGTLTVSSGWTKGYSNKATVNLNGGTLCTYHIHEQNGSTTVNFNGGTLKATKAYTSNGGLIHGNVTVTVGERGGIIDNNAFNVTIASNIGGDGGLTFTGGGTTTLNGEVTYEGATTIEVGTAVVVASADDIGGGLVLTVPATAPADGVYTVLSVSGDETLEGFTLPDAPEKCSLRLSADKKSLLCIYGDPQNTWIGGASGNLSDRTGWSFGFVPTSGDSCVIGNAAAPASLEVGDTFAPSAITFPSGSAAVTIDGRDLTGIVAVTNLSSTSHTINAKVFFDGDIQVKQAAMADVGDLDKAHVTFAGGAYAAKGCAIESGESSAVYSRCVFGKYYLNNVVDNRWTAQYQDDSKRVCVADGSYLYIPYAGDTKELYIGNGAKVDIGDMETSSRLSYQVYGEMVVTNLTVSGTGDLYVSYNQGDTTTGVFKFDKVDNQKTGGWFYFADANKTSKHKFYIGKGGLISPSARFCIGRRNSPGNYEIICPWNDDFTIGARTDKRYNLIFRENVEFHTDDENGKGRTIKIEAKTLTAGSDAKITVSGSGSVIVKNTYEEDTQPTVTVTDTATLAFAAGASLGTGAITLGDGTTLVLTADSKDYTLVNKLNLPSGDNEVATIRIDGKRLRSGDDQEIATVASGTGVALDPNSTALAGRDGWLEVKEGELCLTIKSGGTMIVIR